jgi:NADPH:quinone reductase-like Zn-dependent oxidoreductase
MAQAWARGSVTTRRGFPSATSCRPVLIAQLARPETYAEYVAVSEDEPRARVPSGLDDVVAAALPTAGGAGLALVDC